MKSATTNEAMRFFSFFASLRGIKTSLAIAPVNNFELNFCHGPYFYSISSTGIIFPF